MRESKFRNSLLFLPFLLCWDVAALSSCSTKPPANQREIPKIWPDQLRIRRPAGPGADPHAGQGGIDYRGRPLPNERFDCEPWESLFQDIRLASVRECLSSLKAGVAVYRLRRSFAPALEFDEDEKGAPECLKSVLPKIAVPREILFRTLDDGEPRCYSSRINIEADESFGLKLPKARWALRIAFPVDEPPSDDAAMLRLLGSWAITAFFRDQPGGARGLLPSQYVPARLCERCMGQPARHPRSPLPDGPLWP